MAVTEYTQGATLAKAPIPVGETRKLRKKKRREAQLQTVELMLELIGLLLSFVNNLFLFLSAADVV